MKSISLWRRDVVNQVGVLAQTLEPVAKAGADLRVLMRPWVARHFRLPVHYSLNHRYFVQAVPTYVLSGVMYWMTKVKMLVRALLASAETFRCT